MSAIEVRSLDEIRRTPELLTPPRARIPRLAWSGRVTLLAAREKSGKSTLVAAGCAALTCGERFLDGHATAAPFQGGEPEPGSVLWLSSDAEALSDVALRFVRFGAHDELTRVVIQWDREPASFLALVRAERPTVTVIDTLPAFAAADVEDANASAAWLPLLLALADLARETETALVLVHHATKSTGRYRDSTAIGAAVDAILELEGVEGEPTARRVRARGRFPMDDFTVALHGDRYTLDVGALPLEARVLLAVSDLPGCSAAAVRERVGGRARDCDAALQHLVARNAIVDEGENGRHSYRVQVARDGAFRAADGLALDTPSQGDARDGPRDGAGRAGGAFRTSTRPEHPSRRPPLREDGTDGPDGRAGETACGGPGLELDVPLPDEPPEDGELDPDPDLEARRP